MTRNILIVDDNYEDCVTFRRYLTRNSGDVNRVMEVHSGQLALQHLRYETPDCLLLDYYLPDMDGLDFLAVLQNEAHWPRFPVIVLTASNSPALAVRSMKQGVQDYLTKDTVTRETLLFAVENAIEKHRLQQQVEAQRQELQRRNAEIEAANEALKMRARVLENMAEGVMMAEQDGTIRFTNPAFDQMFGYAPGELLGQHVSVLNDLIPEENERLVNACLKDLYANGRFIGEFPNRTKSGTSFLTRAHISLMESGGKISWVTVQEDITEKKRVARALQESRARFEFLLNSSPVAIFSCIPYGDYHATYMSENVQSILGYTSEQLATPGFWIEHVLPEDRERIVANLDPLFLNGSHTHDYRFRMPDGAYRWVHNELTLVRSAEGEPLEVVGALQDISERKEAEERLRLALEAGQAGTFLHDLKTNTVVWSATLEKILGYLPGEFAGTYDAVLRHVHLEDKERLTAVIGDAIRRCGEYQFEFRMYHLDGRIIWTAGRGRAYARHGTEADTITGVAYDITEQKTYQERLRASEETLRLAAQATGFGTYDYDALQQQTNWSTMLYDIVGIDPTVPLANDLSRQLVHPDDREIFDRMRNLATDPEGTEQHEAEFRIVRPDGRIVWVRDAGQSFRTGEGNERRVVRVVGSILDITERRRQEQEITALNARLGRTVIESSHRIKNHLQVLGALIDMQLNERGEQIPADEFRRVGDHIKALSAIHDLLTLRAKENVENDHIPFKELLDRVFAVIQRSAGRQRIRIAVEETSLSVKHASALVLLLNELVSNAVKHGRGEVDIAFRFGEHNGLLEVTDNGPGFPENFDPRTAANTGLELVAAIVKTDLGGQVTYTNRAEGGAHVAVSFALARATRTAPSDYAVVHINSPSD